MSTPNKHEPKIEQWMRDAAKTYLFPSAYCHDNIERFAENVARHAPSNQPAPSIPAAPSIWRPVSVKPTEKDADKDGFIVIRFRNDAFQSYPWTDDDALEQGTHWCSTADLLARCPLPNEKTQEKTQEEKDAEWIKAREASDGFVVKWLQEAIAYGRQTAKEGGK